MSSRLGADAPRVINASIELADATSSAQKLGLNLSYSNDSQGMDSLNPSQRFNLNQATLTKKGWGGLSKCSQGSQMCSGSYGISTHEWVKSWGINTPLSKTSRCPCQC